MSDNTSSIFSKESSQVITDTNLKPIIALNIDDKPISGKFFIQDFRLEGESNTQINQTFSGNVYLTSFGEKLSLGELVGITIIENCDKKQTNGQTLAEFYKEYRVGNTNKTPHTISIVCNDLVFKGFLLGLILSSTSQTNLRVGVSFILKIVGKYV